MSDRKLRVIVLTHGGCDLAIQKLLELEQVELAAIFVETSVVRRRPLREKLARSIRYDGYLATTRKLASKTLRIGGSADKNSEAIALSRDRLQLLAEENGVRLNLVENYHSEESVALLRETSPDLGLLLGTNILRESVFQVPRLGSINLHQGLAPYYRGGPSIFWELFNGEREIGLTVHSVAPRVDTGDIIVQRTLPLEYDYSYGLDYEAFIDDFRRKLQLPCANLIADAVRMIADGSAAPVPQDASRGTRYRLPTKKEKDELRRRLRERRRQVGYSFAEKVNSGD